jgi:hypothetical protein
MALFARTGGHAAPQPTQRPVLSPLIGFSRSLAVYVVSDVVAGYFVRVTWAVVLAAAFHVWRRAAPPGMSAC